MENKKDTSISLGKSARTEKIFIIGLFEKDKFLLFVYKKAEKIASAFYLVSNFLSDSEPMKWQFRSISLGITSQILSLNIDSSLKPEILAKMSVDLLKMLSFLEVAFTAGFISEMNYIILKNELENLIDTVGSKFNLHTGKSVGPITFDKNFFDVPENPAIVGGAESFSKELSFISDDSSKGHTIKNRKVYNDVLKNISNNGHKGQNISGSSGGERELSIINLLKTKNNLTIKDFSPIIKGCSEKTIQRELLRLVHSGVLKKTGERRWSKYSLAVS